MTEEVKKLVEKAGVEVNVMGSQNTANIYFGFIKCRSPRGERGLKRCQFERGR